MPELPEVETVRRGLQRQTTGLEIARVLVHRPRVIAAPAEDPAEFCRALTGRTVQEWRRRGKYLIAALDRGQWGVHLRMTGHIHWLERISAATTAPCRHTRVQIWNSNGDELRFVDIRSFGQMWWVPPGLASETVITGLNRLGPEPFSEAFSAEHLQQRLKGSTRPIKNALLDQSLVAGVGNIYADESLFAAGILPRPAATNWGGTNWKGCARPWWRCCRPASAPEAPPSVTSVISPVRTVTTVGWPGSTAALANPADTAARRSCVSAWQDAAATGVPPVSPEPSDP